MGGPAVHPTRVETVGDGGTAQGEPDAGSQVSTHGHVCEELGNPTSKEEEEKRKKIHEKKNFSLHNLALLHFRCKTMTMNTYLAKAINIGNAYLIGPMDIEM